MCFSACLWHPALGLSGGTGCVRTGPLFSTNHRMETPKFKGSNGIPAQLIQHAGSSPALPNGMETLLAAAEMALLGKTNSTPVVPLWLLFEFFELLQFQAHYKGISLV